MPGRRDQVPLAVGLSALAIGVGNTLAPRAAGRFWDIAPDSSPVVPHLARIYGLALGGLGAVILMVGEDQRAPVLRVAAVIGLGTAASDLLAWSRGRLGRRGAVMGAAAAGGLGLLAWDAARG